LFESNFLLVKYLLPKTKVLLAAICMISWSALAHAQVAPISYVHPEKTPELQELLKWKEEFTYKVKYSFFTLGEVQTTIVRDTTYEGERLWWLRTKIISDPSIPFMGKEENHYNTFFVETDSLPHTRLYW